MLTDFQFSIGNGQLFRVPIDVAVAANGDVVVADVGASQLLAFTKEGAPKWTFGSSGNERGQFARVTQVAVLETGEVAASDERRQRVVFLSRDGKLLREPHLPFALGRVDGLVGMGGGRIGLAARTRWEGRDAHRTSVHVFSPSLEHLFSFGPVPRVEDPDLLLSWGVGSLRRAPEHGGVILGLKIPYDVWTYSVEGRPLNHIQVPLGREYTADDVWTVERTGHGRVSRRLSSRPVPIPAGAGRIVGGAMLSQRSVQSTGERYWDILDTTGRILQSEAVPSDWIYPSAVADDGATLVVIGEKGGDPAVIVVRVRQVISDRRDEL